MMNELDTAYLGIAEQAVVPVAEHEHVDTGRLEVLELVEFETVRCGSECGSSGSEP
jgi:hypothetical protein